MNLDLRTCNCVLLSLLAVWLSTSCSGKPGKYLLRSPYEDGYAPRYKVNFHAHTTRRDKQYAYSPLKLFEMAKEYGFDAFAITDLPHAGGIVEDPGVAGVLHIPGIEYGGKPHLIGIGIDSLTDSDDKQVQIDHIKKQGGLAYIPHPHWGGYDEAVMDSYDGYFGISVFNSLTYGVAEAKGVASEVIPYNEKVIDAMLTKGKSVAIIAEEDTKYEGTHRYGHQLNTAWVKIWDIDPEPPVEVSRLLEAVSAHRFTSHARHLRSHPDPPEFLRISTNGLWLSVVLDKPSNIKFISAGGRVKKEVKRSTTARYKVSPKDKYIRIKATYTDGYSSWAWTNPVYIHKR